MIRLILPSRLLRLTLVCIVASYTWIFATNAAYLNGWQELICEVHKFRYAWYLAPISHHDTRDWIRGPAICIGTRGLERRRPAGNCCTRVAAQNCRRDAGATNPALGGGNLVLAGRRVPIS
jgi:hypothetical protein